MANIESQVPSPEEGSTTPNETPFCRASAGDNFDSQDTMAEHEVRADESLTVASQCDRDDAKNISTVNSSLRSPETQGTMAGEMDSTLEVILEQQDELKSAVNDANTLAVTKDRKATLSILSLPFDAIHHIFQAAGEHDATLLGLTCTQFYAYLKVARPGKILHHQPSCWQHNAFYPLPCCHAVELDLSRFMLPTYQRYMILGVPKWFDTKVYGAHDSDKVKAFEVRVGDYGAAFKPPFGCRRILPHPVSLGDDWYQLAFKAILEDLNEYHCPKEWYRFWDEVLLSYGGRDCTFWLKNIEIFKAIRDELVTGCKCDTCPTNAVDSVFDTPRSIEEIITETDITDFVKPTKYTP